MPAAALAATPAAGRRRARRRSRRCSSPAPASGRAHERQPAVLLVDDREENLLALRAVLEPLPCRLVSAHLRARTALKALLQRRLRGGPARRPDAGHGRLRDRRADQGRASARARVPIIFVTAISKERHHVFRGYETGAVDYVFKPLRPGDPALEGRGLPRARRASRALRARSEAMLRATFDDAPIGMARLDLDGRDRRGQPRAGERCSGSAPPTCATGCSTSSSSATTRATLRRARALAGGAPSSTRRGCSSAARRARSRALLSVVARAAGRRRCPT